MYADHQNFEKRYQHRIFRFIPYKVPENKVTTNFAVEYQYQLIKPLESENRYIPCYPYKFKEKRNFKIALQVSLQFLVRIITFTIILLS